MGAILYDFPGVPGDADPRLRHPGNPPWLEVRYSGIYEDLRALGLPVPDAPAAAVSREVLVAHLQRLAGDLIDREITADPDDVYPDNATDEELAHLFTQELNGLEEDQVTKWYSHRISVVLRQFPHGPNALTAADVAAARAVE